MEVNLAWLLLSPGNRAGDKSFARLALGTADCRHQGRGRESWRTAPPPRAASPLPSCRTPRGQDLEEQRCLWIVPQVPPFWAALARTGLCRLRGWLPLPGHTRGSRSPSPSLSHPRSLPLHPPQGPEGRREHTGPWTEGRGLQIRLQVPPGLQELVPRSGASAGCGPPAC